MHLQHFFLSFFAVVLHDYNAVCTTKTSSVLVTHYFYGGVVVCAYQRFCFLCSCSLLFFHCRSFSPEWFSSNEIRLPSTSSVINVIVNIKNNVEKDRTLFVCLFFVLFFFLSKSPGGHVIFFRCISVAMPVDWVILSWCASGAYGRSVARALDGPMITKFPRWVDLLSYGAPHAHVELR